MTEKIQFYPDIRKHLSPSSFAAWHNQRSLFLRSYFVGEKTPETAAMKFGKKIHALIEGGFLQVNKRYDNNETELRVPVKDGVEMFGRPDSYQAFGDFAEFVDFKSGKENHFTNAILAQDLKMRCTAWLVWMATGQPQKVTGRIEHIQTRWNDDAREYELADNKSILSAVCVYPAKELEAFTEIIGQTIDEVNAEYPKWLKSSSELVSVDDCHTYAALEAQKREIEAKQKEIKERISGQMSFGGIKNFESPFGTFYATERKTYEYPSTLVANYLGKTYTLADAEGIDEAFAAVKKEYELLNEPKSVSRSLGFRPKK